MKSLTNTNKYCNIMAIIRDTMLIKVVQTLI